MYIENCRICPNECGVNRHTGIGRCHVGAEARICRIAPHMWEEPIISGTHGSGTVFFAGCSLSCVFCQNYKISHFSVGKPYTVNTLIDAIKRLEDAGVHNINFVNPTHYAHIVYEVLTRYKPRIPVVYNTGGYDKKETLQQLSGLIDIYLPDLKYLSPELAKRYSGHEDYPAVACVAIDEMFRQVGLPIIENGIMKKGVIVRHLVLPGQSQESVHVAQYLADTYGDCIYISAMSQYTPHGNLTNHEEINRPIKPIEYKRMVRILQQKGITNCFVQNLDSGDSIYIPDFDI